MTRSIHHTSEALFDIDISTPLAAPVIADLQGTTRLRFRHLDKEDAVLVKSIVRDLGCSLGHKRASTIIDSCIADSYEAFLVYSRQKPKGGAYVEWYHEWIGCLILSAEVRMDKGTVRRCPP